MAEFEPRRAFEHVDRLAYEIGPRLAGSRGDELGADYTTKQFKSYGLQVQVQEFTFVNRAMKRKISAVLLIAALLACFLLPPPFPIAVWVAALAIWISLEKILLKRKSRNIIATLPSKKSEKEVAVTAHFDSAPCTQSYRLHLLLKFSFLPALAIATVSVLLLSLGLANVWLLVVIAAALLPIFAALFISAGGRQVSPGADDNASGVAVMLEVARILASEPSPNITFKFIAFGAEEQGLVGARRLASENLLASGTRVLNLDSVGVGPQPYIVKGNGLLRRTRTPAAVNQALAASVTKAGLEPKLWWAALSGHDHIPLVKRGIDATTLTFDIPERDKLGQRISKMFKLPDARTRRYKYIHDPRDTPDRLEMKTIELAGKIALDFVRTVFGTGKKNGTLEDHTKSNGPHSETPEEHPSGLHPEQLQE